MESILVTGGNGFVGHRVVEMLTRQGCSVTSTVRGVPQDGQLQFDFTLNSDFKPLVEGMDCVIHCAARVHQMHDMATNPETEYQKVNIEATLALARAAADAGVRRFVFLSTAKVSGERSYPGQPLAFLHNEPEPVDPYAKSKYLAEAGLRLLASESTMEVVILRPPLVYGHGVKANFASLVKWTRKGIPLPLGSIDNRRSLIYLDNLVDVILTSLTHPNAANQTFMVADGDDVSTTELLQRIALAMGKRSSRLLPIPTSWLRGLTRIIGRPAIGERLCDSLQLDIRPVKQQLNWHPPYTMTQGLEKMMREMNDE